MNIADAAGRTGLTAYTLRYYEREGLLLNAVRRASSGHRQYTIEDVMWIEMVTHLRSTGMPIRDIRRYAELVRSGAGNDRARLALMQAHRLRVKAQLTAAEAHLPAINAKISSYAQVVPVTPGA